MRKRTKKEPQKALTALAFGLTLAFLAAAVYNTISPRAAISYVAFMTGFAIMIRTQR